MTSTDLPVSQELKPCPFCGGEAQIEPKNWSGRDFIGVFCKECLIFQDSRSATNAEAIAAWNTRALAATPPAPADVERFVERIAKLTDTECDFADLAGAGGFEDAFALRDKARSCLNALPTPAIEDEDVDRVKLALSPLVNEDMDEEMRDAWLDDLARAALASLQQGASKHAE